MRIVGYIHKDFDEVVTTIDAWYNRSQTSWVIQAKNKDGDQIGDSIYVGTKGDAIAAIKFMSNDYPTATVIIPKSLGKI